MYLATIPLAPSPRAATNGTFGTNWRPPTLRVTVLLKSDSYSKLFKPCVNWFGPSKDRQAKEILRVSLLSKHWVPRKSAQNRADYCSAGVQVRRRYQVSKPYSTTRHLCLEKFHQHGTAGQRESYSFPGELSFIVNLARPDLATLCASRIHYCLDDTCIMNFHSFLTNLSAIFWQSQC